MESSLDSLCRFMRKYCVRNCSIHRRLRKQVVRNYCSLFTVDSWLVTFRTDVAYVLLKWLHDDSHIRDNDVGRLLNKTTKQDHDRSLKFLAIAHESQVSGQQYLVRNDCTVSVRNAIDVESEGSHLIRVDQSIIAERVPVDRQTRTDVLSCFDTGTTRFVQRCVLHHHQRSTSRTGYSIHGVAVLLLSFCVWVWWYARCFDLSPSRDAVVIFIIVIIIIIAIPVSIIVKILPVVVPAAIV